MVSIHGYLSGEETTFKKTGYPEITFRQFLVFTLVFSGHVSYVAGKFLANHDDTLPTKQEWRKTDSKDRF